MAIVCERCDNGNMSQFLSHLLAAEPGFERELVERYSQRLLDLARRNLPERVRQRVDPEDVVQSVYRSFFQRLNEGRFSFEESGDVWRLLAAMTFQKVRRASRFHRQQRRDVRRELPLDAGGNAGNCDHRAIEAGPEDVAALYECLESLLTRLPAKYREIIVLRLEGDSLDQIARKVNRSRRTVFRALADAETLAVRLSESAS